MFRHILVPLDGSRHAEQALPVAARLARASEGTIILVQVVDSTRATTSDYSPKAQNALTEMGKNYLEHLLQLSSLSDITIQTDVVQGNPPVMIASLAATLPADLILLASHGYAGVRRWFMGSVAEYLARCAQVPVLVLHAQKPLRIHRNVEGTSFVRALVPVDTSASSFAAVVPAARLVSALSSPGQGEVHLAHVVISSADENMPELETRLQVARQKLKAVSQKVSSDPNFPPIVLTWAVTLEPSVAQGIVRRAEHGEHHVESKAARKSDLIAMTTCGAKSAQKWIEESVTEHVLHSTHLPVLVVHPNEKKEDMSQQAESLPMESGEH